MLLRAVLFEPLAQTSDSNARRLADARVGVAETSLDERPDLAHERRHVLAAALDGDTERKHRTTAARGVARGEVVADEVAERREDLAGRQAGRETVDDA